MQDVSQPIQGLISDKLPHESAVIVTSSDSIVFIKTSITSPHAGTLMRLVVA